MRSWEPHTRDDVAWPGPLLITSVVLWFCGSVGTAGFLFLSTDKIEAGREKHTRADSFRIFLCSYVKAGKCDSSVVFTLHRRDYGSFPRCMAVPTQMKAEFALRNCR